MCLTVSMRSMSWPYRYLTTYHHVVTLLCGLLLLSLDAVNGGGVWSDNMTSSSHVSRSRHGRAKDDGVCELEISCRGGSDDTRLQQSSGGSSIVRLPIRGPRGPAGPPGPPGEKGQRGQDGHSGQTGEPIGVQLRTNVAFFVGLSLNLGPVATNTDVVFDRVVTNVGAAYDLRTGRFSAPVNGTYQLNVVVSAQGKQKAAVSVVHNGKMVATVWAESIPSWGTSSNTVILSLSRGDRVGIVLLRDASYLHGYMYTTFSGFLLFEN